MGTSDKFINRIREFIVEQKLLEGISNVVVGVSGGADSVCLFEVFCRLRDEFGYNMDVVHVNHCLRGEEADGDEEYVRRICYENSIRCTVFKKDIKGMVAEEKITEEEAGRIARYDSFKKIASEYDSNKTAIAVAHNMNDTCETMLFNLFRGTGLKGLAGISAINSITSEEGLHSYRIIRPLLCVERKEIEEFLLQEKIEFKTDRTNLEEDYTRNKIRHNIVSYASNMINNKAISHMALAADKVREAEEFIEEYTNLKFEKIVKADGQNNMGTLFIDINKILDEKIIIQKRIIRKALEIVSGKLKDIEEVHIDDVMSLINKQTGRKVNLPYGMIARRSYDNIEINVYRTDSESNLGGLYHEIEFDKNYYLEYVDSYVRFSLKKCKKNEIIPKNNYTKWFDYDKIYNVILLRNCREGDYITINTNGNKKSLKDYFKDCKIRIDDRCKVPLLADGNQIMWIFGHRTSEAYRVDEYTENILEVTLLKQGE